MLTDRIFGELLVLALLLGVAGCQDGGTERGQARTPSPVPSYRSDRPAGTEEDSLRERAGRVARQHGLNPAFVSAVVGAESGWDPLAVSSKGARGLMQLMPGTARTQFGLRDNETLFDARANLRLGIAHLAKLVETYCDARLALWAWHAGTGAVDPAASHITPPESRRFVRQVLNAYREAGGRPQDLTPGGCKPAPTPQLVTEETSKPERPPVSVEAPKPVVTSAWVSALNTRVGEAVDLRLEAENRGGPAEAGTLEVMVADHPELRLGFRSDLEATVREHGARVGSFGTDRLPIEQPTIMARADPWPEGEGHYLYVRLVPAETGRVVLTYRFTLEGPRGSRHTYPESSVHRPGQKHGRRVEIDVTQTLKGGNR